MAATTWNPLDCWAAIVLSGGNLIATGPGFNGNQSGVVRGTNSHTTGKWAFELTVTAHTTVNGAYYGFANAAAVRTSTAGVCGLSQTSSAVFNGSSTSGTAPGNSTILIAVDLTGSVFCYSLNGGVSFIGGGNTAANPVTGSNCISFSALAGQAMFPYFAAYGGGGGNDACNFNPAPVGAIPSGFLGWDAVAIGAGSGSRMLMM